MPSSYQMTRRVVFSETDAAGIAHFSNFFRWMEEAEHAFLRSLGSSVHRQDATGLHGYARVKASCEYHQPLRFEDEFSVEITVCQITDKSMTYDFVFKYQGAEKPVATGEMTVVCIVRAVGEDKMSAASIPEDIRSQITVHAM